MVLDPSIMEITVIAVKDSREALSTLKIQRNNIDLIVTDYYMPGMNGLQLKRQITQEFGNLPVIGNFVFYLYNFNQIIIFCHNFKQYITIFFLHIFEVMSSDTNKEQESLTCGAMCFIPKPIKPDDLTKIYQYALTYKRNGKSILWTEQNHKDTNVSVPRQIQLLPEQANVSKTKKKKKCSSKSDSRSANSTNTSCVSTDGSRKNRKRKSSGSSGDNATQPSKKSKVQWTDDLHHLFLRAIRHIGLDSKCFDFILKKLFRYYNIRFIFLRFQVYVYT